MGFPFWSGSYKFAIWVLYILRFIDISKCSCFVLLKNNVALYSCLPSPRTWVICETIVKLLSPITNSCVLNQNHGHLLFEKCLAFYNVNKSSSEDFFVVIENYMNKYIRSHTFWYIYIFNEIYNKIMFIFKIQFFKNGIH